MLELLLSGVIGGAVGAAGTWFVERSRSKREVRRATAERTQTLTVEFLNAAYECRRAPRRGEAVEPHVDRVLRVMTELSVRTPPEVHDLALDVLKATLLDAYGSETGPDAGKAEERLRTLVNERYTG